jgi:hypothetical protein
MKRIFIACTFILFAAIVHAQNVGIGTSSPNASALLELQSTNKGLLLPRVADTGSVTSPARGLLVFANASNKVWFYDGSRWQQATGAGGIDANWQLQGDSLLYTDKKYVSINTDKAIYPPVAGLQATGSLLIQQPANYSKSLPTAAQTITMNNTGTLQIPANTDSTGRIFDPGGAGTNYFNNMQGNLNIPLPVLQITGINFSFNANDFGLATGDTLWFSKFDFPACRTDYYYRFTNTSIVPADINIKNSISFIYILFRSNGDNVNSKGFDITWKKLYSITDASTLSTAGNALAFNANNGSLRAGAIPNGSIGSYSIAVGNNTIASGNTSTALGYNTIASGYNSTALGYGTEASGYISTALGQLAKASGSNSIAIGLGATASGYTSTALGYGTEASGSYSTALGYGTEASGSYSTALGKEVTARSYASVVMGQFNDSVSGSSISLWEPTDPLLILGNGTVFSRSNALVVYKNGNTDINGYTQLGKNTEGAPAIKMKKFTATSGAAQTGSITIAHGLNRAKIIGVQVLLNYGANVADIPSGYTDVAGYEYNWQVNDSDVWILNKNGNSANILSKPIKILITYEE